MLYALEILCVIIVVFLALWLGSYFAIKRRESTRSLAAEEFLALRESLLAEFLKLASESGIPRGLCWLSCVLPTEEDEIKFATDRNTNELIGLTTVIISFEAVKGGDMEDVEAVSNLRAATAIFVHSQAGWRPTSRALFNLKPSESIERFAERYLPWTHENN